MMKRDSMFLIELISMILVFSVCAAVCVSLMGKAWTISRDSERLTHAVYLAESAAARLQAGGDYAQKPDGGYVVRIESRKGQENLTQKEVVVLYQDEQIYTLTVVCGEGLS